MNIYDSLEEVCPTEDRAVALGLFDGVHCGHRAVIQQALDCEKNGLRPAVFTYRIQHDIPERKTSFKWIIGEEERLNIFEKMGVRDVVQPKFEDFAQISAEEFIEDFLIKKMRAKVICCGEDFRFGNKAKGNVSMLREYCRNYGIELKVISEIIKEEQKISSSDIRDLISSGDMEKTWEMLGRPYSIKFPVVSGNKIGRTLDFPTINQVYPENFVIPKYGVYATVSEINGKFYPSVTNVGVKPTIGIYQPLSETFIIGFSGNLYGSKIRVNFCEFIRPERKFQNLDDLKNQIADDTSKAFLIAEPFVEKLQNLNF